MVEVLGFEPSCVLLAKQVVTPSNPYPLCFGSTPWNRTRLGGFGDRYRPRRSTTSLRDLGSNQGPPGNEPGELPLLHPAKCTRFALSPAPGGVPLVRDQVSGQRGWTVKRYHCPAGGNPEGWEDLGLVAGRKR